MNSNVAHSKNCTFTLAIKEYKQQLMEIEKNIVWGEMTSNEKGGLYIHIYMYGVVMFFFCLFVFLT